MRLWKPVEYVQHTLIMTLTTGVILFGLVKVFLVPWPTRWVVILALVVTSAFTVRYYWNFHKLRLARIAELEYRLNYGWLHGRGVRYYDEDPDRAVND